MQDFAHKLAEAIYEDHWLIPFAQEVREDFVAMRLSGPPDAPDWKAPPLDSMLRLVVSCVEAGYIVEFEGHTHVR